MQKQCFLKARYELIAVIVDLMMSDDIADIIPEPYVRIRPKFAHMLLNLAILEKRGCYNVLLEKRFSVFSEMCLCGFIVTINYFDEIAGFGIVLTLDQNGPIPGKDINAILFMSVPTEEPEFLLEYQLGAVSDKPLKLLLGFRAVIPVVGAFFQRS